ncbi:MAG: hypothetical protein LC121_11595 [Anaerolineae bacterium]|nr:hypothetical protein [Anaerolineae bacterium]
MDLEDERQPIDGGREGQVVVALDAVGDDGDGVQRQLEDLGQRDLAQLAVALVLRLQLARRIRLALLVGGAGALGQRRGGGVVA